MPLRFEQFPYPLEGLSEWLASSLPFLDEEPPAELGALSITEPVPAYYADAREFLRQGTAAGTRSGWRSAVLAGDSPVALLDIGLSGGGEPRFATRSREAALAFEEALVVATQAAANPDYDVRWLALSDIYVTTLWLEGANSRFVPTRLGTVERVAPDLLTLADLQERVIALVNVQTAFRREDLAKGQLWSTRSPTSGLPDD